MKFRGHNWTIETNKSVLLQLEMHQQHFLQAVTASDPDKQSGWAKQLILSYLPVYLVKKQQKQLKFPTKAVSDLQLPRC